jgi:RNA polymerase primary sigma factor
VAKSSDQSPAEQPAQAEGASESAAPPPSADEAEASDAAPASGGNGSSETSGSSPAPTSSTTTTTTTTTTKKNDKATGALEDQSALGIYFREMAAVQVMTPAEEQAAADKILRARTELWRSMLAYAPFVPAIITIVEHTFNPDSQPREELKSIVQTSRKFRDRQTRANETAFEKDAESLSGKMARLDTDGEAFEPITNDLLAILGGKRDDLVLQVTLPPTGSVPFRRYVDRVKKANANLWRAKDKFVRANLRLVVTMARRYNRGTLPLPDLIQEGNIGLMKAVDRFDPERGFRFSTYASWWIRHAISRALADKGREVRVPVHMIDVYHKLKRTRQRFATLKGREPTDEELAKEAEVPLDKIQRLRQCLLDAGPSLDSPVAGAEGRTVGELLEDESTPLPAEFLQARAMGDKVRELLSRLRPIEADVLRKRFGLDEGEPMTLREIGEQYSLSRERIRQLQEQALGKIRRELRRQDLI